MRKIEVKTKCGETFTLEVDTNQEIESMEEIKEVDLPDITHLFAGRPLKHDGWGYFAIPALGPGAHNNDTTDTGYRTKGTLIWVHNVSEEKIGVQSK